jgi:hypothetical protein
MYINGDYNANCQDGLGGPYTPFEVNVSCFTTEAIDVAGTEIDMSSTLILNDVPFTVSGVLQNRGLNAVNSMDINYSINGGDAVTQSVTGLNLATGDFHAFDHASSWNPTSAGSFTIDVWATNINGADDMNTSNDMISATVTVFDNATLKRPLLESFTSSTCPPCAPGNINVSNVLSNYNDDQYSLLKYQMNFPGSGDPYYTEEIGERATYHDLSFVPLLVVDGNEWQDNSNSFTSTELDNALAEPSFVELSSYFQVNVDDQTVDININIEPLGDISSDLTLHTAIFETITYQNVGTNGETEFENVMKKMIPNASGTAIGSLESGVELTESLTYTFQGEYVLPADASQAVNHAVNHTVEDFENLGVIVWLEDETTKDVIQSTVAVSGTPPTNITEYLSKNIMTFPNPTSNTTTVAFQGMKGENVTIKIYNLLGEMVYDNLHTSDSDFEHLTIDVSKFSNGVYSLVFKVGSSIHTKKIQVLK